jgi:ComF family protein
MAGETSYNGSRVSATLPMLSNSRRQKFDIALQKGRDALRGLLAAIGRGLPAQCALCAAACGDALLCGDCTNALPMLGDACPSCALPAPARAVCGACLARPPSHARTVAALAYAFPADRLVARLKYGHDLPLADALAVRLESAVRARYAGEPLPDAVVPLPLSAARQRERGFNQACEIARPLARALRLPLHHAIVRQRDAPAQASLPRARRAANVRGAFRADRPVRGLRLALVDDVMTTGATMDAASRALLAAGAAAVDAWVVARTLPTRTG